MAFAVASAAAVASSVFVAVFVVVGVVVVVVVVVVVDCRLLLVVVGCWCCVLYSLFLIDCSFLFLACWLVSALALVLLLLLLLLWVVGS